MSTEMSISFSSVGELANFLTEMGNRVADPTALADGLGTIVRDDYRLKFQSAPASETGGSIWGGAFWRPLTEGYLMARPDLRKGRVLIDTGATMRAFTDVNAAGNVSEVEATSDGFTMTFGADLPHIPKLQETWAIAFWHPALLERVSSYLATAIVEGTNA